MACTTSCLPRELPGEFAHCRIPVEWDEQHYAHPAREEAMPACVTPMDSVVERTIDGLLRRQLGQRSAKRHVVAWIADGDR